MLTAMAGSPPPALTQNALSMITVLIRQNWFPRSMALTNL
jgi:hypothetical protein